MSDGEPDRTATLPGVHGAGTSVLTAVDPDPFGPGRPTPSPASTGPPPLRPGHARRRRNRRIIVWSSVALLVVVVATAGLMAARRIDRTLPRPAVAVGRTTASLVPGPAPTLPWPAGGQAAVSVPALGWAEQSGPEPAVPIASLAKMATAVVVLRDHPVPLGGSGPTITVTPDEAAQFDVDLDNDETNIPLVAGENVTELQLLQALVVQSANDAAYTLAAWDAGSQQAFVAKLNALSTSLGADHSHYVDASGFDPGTVSTAADVLRVAAAAMAIPTFASVADMPTANLPGVGTVHNIVTAVGTDGIVGVKSGYTSQASGCMVLAAWRTVHGRSVLVLASALGQREPTPAPPPPPTPTAPVAGPTTTTTVPAAPTATTTTVPYSPLEAQYPLLYTEPVVEHLLDASEAAVVAVPVSTAGSAVGTASADWGGVQEVVPVVAARSAWLFGIPGQRVDATTVPVPTSRVAGDPGPAGSVRFTLGSQSASVPVHLERPVPDPGWWWKLLHD